jgi:hypothetical protein
VVDGLILFNGCIYIGPLSVVSQSILEVVHGAGHEGVHKTLHRLRADFQLPKDRVVVHEFVRMYSVCQRSKTLHLQSGGLLQPMGVSTSI